MLKIVCSLNLIFRGMVTLVLGEEGRNERWARAVSERLPRNALQKMEHPAVTVGRGVEKLKQKGPSFDEPKWQRKRCQCIYNIMFLQEKKNLKIFLYQHLYQQNLPVTPG